MAKSDKKNIEDLQSRLWQDFIHNPFYLGTIAFTEEIEKIKPIKILLNSEAERKYVCSGVWRGVTGRLKFREMDNSIQFVGKYDWNGYAFSGHLEGVVFKTSVIFFKWKWDRSNEKGYGFFEYNPKSLCGGWWFEDITLDVDKILNKEAEPPNKWEFYKSSAIDDKTSSISIVREKVSGGEIEEAIEEAMLFINIYYHEHSNDIYHLSSRFSKWKNDNLRGLQNNMFELNSISYSLLELMNKIEKISE